MTKFLISELLIDLLTVTKLFFVLKYLKGLLPSVTQCWQSLNEKHKTNEMMEVY